MEELIATGQKVAIHMKVYSTIEPWGQCDPNQVFTPRSFLGKPHKHHVAQKFACCLFRWNETRVDKITKQTLLKQTVHVTVIKGALPNI